MIGMEWNEIAVHTLHENFAVGQEVSIGFDKPGVTDGSYVKAGEVYTIEYIDIARGMVTLSDKTTKACVIVRYEIGLFAHI